MSTGSSKNLAREYSTSHLEWMISCHSSSTPITEGNSSGRSVIWEASCFLRLDLFRHLITIARDLHFSIFLDHITVLYLLRFSQKGSHATGATGQMASSQRNVPAPYSRPVARPGWSTTTRPLISMQRPIRFALSSLKRSLANTSML